MICNTCPVSFYVLALISRCTKFRLADHDLGWITFNPHNLKHQKGLWYGRGEAFHQSTEQLGQPWFQLREGALLDTQQTKQNTQVLADHISNVSEWSCIFCQGISLTLCQRWGRQFTYWIKWSQGPHFWVRDGDFILDNSDDTPKIHKCIYMMKGYWEVQKWTWWEIK